MTSSSSVQLYRYDLTNGMARTMAPMLIGRSLEGIWHTSIVVFGKEFYFDGGVGIVAGPSPGRTRFGTPYRTETLGTTQKSEAAFMAWCQARRSGVADSSGVAERFGPNDYQLLTNNCNHFSQAACRFLLSCDIPADVRNMIPELLATPLGQMIRPTLEQMTSAPNDRFPAMAAAGASSPSGPVPGFPASAATISSSSHDVCRGLLSPRAGLTESEQEDVDLLKVTLESNELIADGDTTTDGFETTLTSLNLLRSVMEKIVAFPADPKYRALSTASKTYTNKLKRLEPFGALDILRLAGFTLRPHPSTPGSEQWYLSDAAGSKPVLTQLITALDEVIEAVETAQAIALSAKEATADATPTSTSGTRAVTNSTSAAPSTTPETAPCTVSAVPPVNLLCYAALPFPAGYVPFPVGEEGGQPMYSILVTPKQSRESVLCLGKCQLPPGELGSSKPVLHGQICTAGGVERNVSGALAVLCVREAGVPAKDGRDTSTSAADALMWVPAPLVRAALREAASTSSSANTAPSDFVYRAHGRFGVARAPMGAPGAVHAGVYEPAGRCVIPYGGKAHVVTHVAQVLCFRACVPAAVRARVEALHVGDALLQAVQADLGKPWSSFAGLRAWTAPASSSPAYLTVPVPSTQTAPNGDAGARKTEVRKVMRAVPCPLRPRHVITSTTLATAQKRLREEAAAHTMGSTAREDRTHLLVCHDMKGGYTPADYPHFVLEDSAGVAGKTAVLKDVEDAYTVSYWQLMDIFVYFSHQRVSVPPYEWVEAGHRRGVPVLGTIITEGSEGLAELKTLLTDAKVMGETINKLVELCVAYGFDGYLLNIENSLENASQVKRLELFTKMLKTALQEALPRGSGIVIWYDAVTTEGRLTYQNALTPKNKPFMDVCDGIFTNYFWNPMHLALSKAAAAGRERDIYVGVDVFGRQMYGGGQYNTFTAVHEAAKSGLSVALFAPGWTAESEGKGSRETFLRAESRLWSRMQNDFIPHTVEVVPPLRPNASASTGFWTCFVSGVGTTFNVDGRVLCTNAASQTGAATGWCQLSAAHQPPAFAFLAPDEQMHKASWQRPTLDGLSSGASSANLTAATAPLQCRLPLVSEGGRTQGDTVTATWMTAPPQVYFGDRALLVLVPPASTVKLLDTHEYVSVPLRGSASQASKDDEEGEEGRVTATVLLHVDVAYLEPSDAPTNIKAASLSSSSGALAATSRRICLFFRPSQPSAVPSPAATASASASGLVYHRVDLCDSDSTQCELIAEYPSTATPQKSDSSGQATHMLWRVRRYTWRATAASLADQLGLSTPMNTSSSSLDLVVNAVALTNTCRDRSLACHVGGLAIFAPPSACHRSDITDTIITSPLTLGAPLRLSADTATPSWTCRTTSSSAVQLLALQRSGLVRCLEDAKRESLRARMESGATIEMALFADMVKCDSSGVSPAQKTTLFLGVRRVACGGATSTPREDDDVLVLIPVHMPSAWTVTSVYCFPYSLPF